MNGIKTGLGITPGEHIISADSALSRNIRQCFCLSYHAQTMPPEHLSAKSTGHDRKGRNNAGYFC